MPSNGETKESCMSGRTDYYNDLFKRAGLVVRNYYKDTKRESFIKRLLDTLNRMRRGDFNISPDSAYAIFEALNSIKKDNGLAQLFGTCRFIASIKGDVRQGERDMKLSLLGKSN